MEENQEKHWSEMSKSELIEDFRKSKEDPKYFIRRYIKIIHQLRGEICFDLYPFQERIIDDLQDNRFNIIRKFRQAGITTLACAYGLWIALFQSNKTIPILSIGDTESTEVLARIKLMYDELPPHYKPGLTKSTEHALFLGNGSKILSRPSKKTSGRSLSGYLLIIDEAAFIENIDDIWAAVYPIISTGGRVFIISTVNGTGNWYYDTYTRAKEETNEFNAIDIHWKEHPEYWYNSKYDDLYKECMSLDKKYNVNTWLDITQSNIGNKRWLQEYEMEFLGTGETFIDGGILRELSKRVSEDYYIKYNNRMRVWKDPDPNYEYAIGVDVSLGRNRDYSAFHIINLYNGEQVAEFYSNKTPINELAEILNREAVLYNTAYVLIERNTIGDNLIDWLYNILEYENLWCDEKGDFGFQITTRNRESLLASLEEAIRTNVVKITSERTVKELLTFVVNERGKAEADRGNHDDLVSSLSLAVYGLNTLIEDSLIEHESIPHKESKPLVPTSTNKAKLHTSFGGITEEDLKWLMK